jgi:hypothetical protein
MRYASLSLNSMAFRFEKMFGSERKAEGGAVAFSLEVRCSRKPASM